jgi:hypothetical protein
MANNLVSESGVRFRHPDILTSYLIPKWGKRLAADNVNRKNYSVLEEVTLAYAKPRNDS